ncbi:MAG TPA: hypothetical protein ENO24_04255, partial [Chloroflexi bacterium]|nr:hypothetical protein [Chloroflexota bacterium]
MSRSLVAHPLLFAVFPALFMYSQNADRVPPEMVAVPVFLLVLVTLAAWSLLTPLAGDYRRAGLIVSLFLLLFFSYGICYVELRASVAGRLFGSPLTVAGSLLAVWGGVLALGAYSFVKTERD